MWSQCVSEVRKSEFFLPAFRSASFIVTPEGLTLGAAALITAVASVGARKPSTCQAILG